MDSNKVDLNLLVALEALLAERNVTPRSEPAGAERATCAAARSPRRPAVFAGAAWRDTDRASDRTSSAGAPVRDVLARGRGFDPATADLTVAIACSDYVQVAVIAPLALDLRVSASKLPLAIRQLDGDLLGQQMEAGVVDLAVMTPSTAPPALRTRLLFRECYVAIARRRHPEVKGKLTLDDFVALEHVVVSPRGAGFSGPVERPSASSGATAASRCRRQASCSCPSLSPAPT
jgi:hypothetical protein